jgi:hypothetical protein
MREPKSGGISRVDKTTMVSDAETLGVSDSGLGTAISHCSFNTRRRF